MSGGKLPRQGVDEALAIEAAVVLSSARAERRVARRLICPGGLEFGQVHNFSAW